MSQHLRLCRDWQTWGPNGTAVQAWTLDFLRGNNEQPDVIVIDPPRAGLGAEITTALAEIGAPSMTYVSCDPATIAIFAHYWLRAT